MTQIIRSKLTYEVAHRKDEMAIGRHWRKMEWKIQRETPERVLDPVLVVFDADPLRYLIHTTSIYDFTEDNPIQSVLAALINREYRKARGEFVETIK